MAQEKEDTKQQAELADFINTLYKVIDCLNEVGDVDGMPGLPRLEQSQAAIVKMRALMDAYVARHADADPRGEGVGSPGAVSIGPGPYRSTLVSATTGTAMYVSESEFESEKDAIENAIAEAKRRNMKVDPDMTRHWITEDGAGHLIDFGSHAVYACIVAAGGTRDDN